MVDLWAVDHHLLSRIMDNLTEGDMLLMVGLVEHHHHHRWVQVIICGDNKEIIIIILHHHIPGVMDHRHLRDPSINEAVLL
jgi:hypothetical protein